MADDEKKKESVFINFESSEIVRAIDRIIEATADYIRQMVPTVSYIVKKMKR